MIKHVTVNTAAADRTLRITAVNRKPKADHDAKEQKGVHDKQARGNAQDAGEAVTVKISQSAAYPPINPAYVQKALEETEKQSQAFVEMLRKLFLSQGKNASAAALSLTQGILPDSGLADIVAGLTPDQETIDQAKEAVSEDGYYGVKKTSERILSFAKAIAGNDPSKIDQMRAAVEQGFAAAKEVWGKELPDICKETYDVVMKGFDDWKSAAVQVTSAA